MGIGNKSKSKAWIKEFLFVRGLISGPDATSLYQYHVTDDEYDELPAVLKQSFPDIESPSYSPFWSAAFCLFVAEKYRREYDGSGLGWSWSGFEEPLSIELSSLLHREVVKKGLEFWKRPIRLRSNGYDYLGSLFDEGGLPWKLIQSETHGFGRAVRGSVANYYRVKQAGGDVVSVISKYAQYFPQTFRTHEKYLLLASIIEWLMGLAEAYPISTVDNPADYLDEKAPGWRKQSPLPVGESNARNLINEWLIDAGKSRAEKKRLESDEKNYTCEHWLTGNFADWSIRTDVFLPAEVSIELDECSIQSTRIEIAFYEGDNLLKRSGIAHGKINDDRSKIAVKINSRAIAVPRLKLELPLTVQFLSNGQRVHACYFEGSDVDYSKLPMIFVKEGGQLKLLSTASTSITSKHVVVRVPPELNIVGAPECQLLEEDLLGGKWIDVSENITLSGLGSKVILRFEPDTTIGKPTLAGTVSLYNTLPNLVYRGWPIVKTSDGVEGQPYKLFINGVPLQYDYQKNVLGSFALSVVGESGETLLRRKIGVIPKDLRVLSISASANNPAKVILRSSRKLSVQLISEALKAEAQASADGHVIAMEPRHGCHAPEQINLEIRDGINPGDPVVLRLPYPKTGAQIFNDLGNEVTGQQISLDQLIEMSMTLTPRPDMREQFFVSLELRCQGIPNFSRHYPFVVKNQSQRISLYAFQEDIQQMLGTSSNQDATVRIRVETDRILKQMDIVRYNARLEGPNAVGRLEVLADNLANRDTGLRVSGLRLDDPGATPVDVTERTSQGVGMGVFEIPEKMMKNGPWLLFPPTGSVVRFRPSVWITEDLQYTEGGTAKSLHAAAKQFHPKHNPDAFTPVILAMAGDLAHSGWDYLRSLKSVCSELPLSALESWKALARNTASLAAAVFRLELTPAFCKRISNELAVIWEAVDVQTWVKARAAQRDFLMEQGIADEFAEKLIEDRIYNVASAIPCFVHLADYLKLPRHVNLKQVPYVFATICFKDLRRNHADDQRWPEWLKVELTNWVHQQDFPAEIKTLPDVGFARAVAFLPVFMAAVTAGKADFKELTESLPELRFAVRVLSDFDRDAWYEPTYSLVLSNLLLESEE
jgi:hypothetical protein